MSNLVKHAEAELKAAGFYDKTTDEYHKMIAEAVLRMVRGFADEGHSGMSASITLQIFNKVVNFEPLSPVTNNPYEWNHVGERNWQSSRYSEAFSRDGGQTYYILSEKRKFWYDFVSNVFPRRLLKWVWDNHPGVFFPIHRAAPYKSLDKSPQVA